MSWPPAQPFSTSSARATIPAASPRFLVADLPLLDITDAVAEIVAAYVRHRLVPADPAGDALHLALASYHKCDFLVTWNCQHLANANKFGHLRRVNGLLGLYVPVLATPLELLGEIDDPKLTRSSKTMTRRSPESGR